MNNNKIMFMIVNDDVAYLQNSEMDHREWYISLGLNPDEYENVIRGFVMDGKIVFFKGSTFSYDADVMKAAKVYGARMRKTLNNQELGICCGIMINGYNSKWEPIVKINDDELVPLESDEKYLTLSDFIPKDDVVDFKNNYSDASFRKRAILATLITIILSIIIKVILVSTNKMYMSKFGDFIIVASQIIFLFSFIVGCLLKKNGAKLFGIAASLSLLLTFDILDLILGVTYFLFIVDEKFFSKFIAFSKGMIGKLKNLKKS